MRNTFRRILCCLMILLMLPSAVPARADEFEAKSTVYIIADTLKAYKKANTSSKVLGTMTYGEDMTMLSFSGEWVRIKNDKGKIGYCKLEGLSSKNPNNLDEVAYAKESKTPVYQKPGTSYKKISRVKKNYQFNVIAKTPDGKWLRVKNGSKYGYVLAEDVNKNPLDEHGALVTKKVYVTSEGAYEVRSGKGSGKDLGLISHGQSFNLLGTSGKYARIRNSKGKIGWCLEELLTTENPNNMNATMYAQVSGNMLYSNSIIKGSGKYLKKGAKVKVVAESPEGGWYRVKYNGKYYYVCSILLNDEKAPDNGREVYSLQDENLYAKASLSSKKVGRVEKDETLRLIGMSKGGAKVKTADGVTGYVPIGLLEPYAWTFAVRRT